MNDHPAFAPPRSPSPEDCWFYHAFDLPNVGEVGWEWDLRDGIDAYLGGVELGGSRVLEIGPANGFVTFELERRGADVLAVDLPEATPVDFIPLAGLDAEWIKRESNDFTRRLRNGFWFAHRSLGSNAKVFEGRVTDLPADVGEFDVAFLGAVLLHVRDALGMLYACAARVRSTLVVAERAFPDLLSEQLPSCRLACRENDPWLRHNFWEFSPAFFTNALGVIGFTLFELSLHEQRHRSGMIPFFTLVAQREEPGSPVDG